MHLLRQALWEHNWKGTAEKSQTNATNATMHPLVQTIWGIIWKFTEEKRSNVRCVTLKYQVELVLRGTLKVVTTVVNVNSKLKTKTIWLFTDRKNTNSNAPHALFKQDKKMHWKHIMSTDTRAKLISAINVIILLVINIPWIYTWKTNTLEWDLTAQSVITRPRKKEIWKFTWRQSMMESSMIAISASIKPAPREVLVYTWNQNTDTQLRKTIKLWKSIFNADDDED